MSSLSPALPQTNTDLPELTSLSLGGTIFYLLPDRALLHQSPQSTTLIIADLHFGKDAHWRKHGQYVPEVALQDLERIVGLINQHQASRVIFAGDLIHSKTTKDFVALADLFDTQLVEFILVAGNHDRWSSEKLSGMKLKIVPELFINDVLIIHDRSDLTSRQKQSNQIFICGHEHPGVKVPGEVCVPAFLRVENGLVLPAFGSFNGCLRFKSDQYQQAWLAVEGKILEW